MPLCTVHWYSQNVEKNVAMNVLLPTHGKPPYPVYYLLHGLTDDYTAWLRRSRIEVHAERYPMVVVMPDGYRTFYTNSNSGRAYGRYIGEELPTFVETHFNVKKTRAGRCIGGLSMGGYGALRTALAYPDRFASANSHSGAMLAGTRVRERFHTDPEHMAIFGTSPGGTDHDLLKLARSVIKSKQKMPRMLIDVGIEDYLLDDNREFHKKLQAMNVAHEYVEFPGTHDWDYWDTHVREALAFHAKAMGIKS